MDLMFIILSSDVRKHGMTPGDVVERLNNRTVIVVETKTEVVNDDSESSEVHSELVEDECKIDSLFYQICHFCFILGVNFYHNRCPKMRALSMVLVAINCCINSYFIGYVAFLCLSQRFDANRVATSITLGTWVLQATLSTLFLAFWQSSNETGKMLELLYEANNGRGIQHHRPCLVAIVRSFHVVLGLIICYEVGHMIANILDYNVGYMDAEIPTVRFEPAFDFTKLYCIQQTETYSEEAAYVYADFLFGDRRLFIIVQLTNLYCTLCWGVALFIFSLLIHSTHFEFAYFNNQVRSIKCNHENKSDDALCDHLLEMMKTHCRLTDCVNKLDKMFHRYAFFMVTTIIPTTIFSLFMVVHRPDRAFSYQLLFSCPLVVFCLFTFFMLVDPPSQLHDTIYNTKSALCANTHIWFPYRQRVYHSALAFVAHLDQTNLGVSLWGFAITLSVMVTCLATFLQLGESRGCY